MTLVATRAHKQLNCTRQRELQRMTTRGNRAGHSRAHRPHRAGHSGSPSLDSLATQPSYLYTDDAHEVDPLEPGKGVEPKSAGDNQGVINRTVFTNTVLNKHTSNFESIAEVERLIGVRSK